MRQKPYARLEQLEPEYALVLATLQHAKDREDADHAIKKFELFLRLCGTEQGPQKSLAGAVGRAIGITSRELREQLSAGIDPIHQYSLIQACLRRSKEDKPPGRGPAAGERNYGVRL